MVDGRWLPLHLGVANVGNMRCGHGGLRFEKFCDKKSADGNGRKGRKDAELFAEWLRSYFDGRFGDPWQIRATLAQRRRLAAAIGAERRRWRTDWHFTTGLGNPHPTENGFCWHPTLGVPYLPASSLKGVLRNWFDQWGDADNDRWQEWFGTSDRGGTIALFDALPCRRVTVCLDVITPHRGKWYAAGGNDQHQEEAWQRRPADWFEPKPVTFLCAKDVEFDVMIARTSRGTSADVELLFSNLKEALEVLGAGAKTDAGYGRMTLDGQ